MYPFSLKEGYTGDLDEEYAELVQMDGFVSARRWLWQQVFRSVPEYFGSYFSWGTGMIKNFLKTSLRNLYKEKVYSLINITGLAVGLAACFLILMFIHHELSYDRHHEHAERLYRIAISARFGGTEYHAAGVAAPSAQAILNDYPEVADITRLYRPPYQKSVFVRHKEKVFKEVDILFADASLFNVFTIPFLSGDKGTALIEPNSLVISERISDKYFGSSDPVGQILTFDNQIDYKITGVFQNIPDNTHFQSDFFASLVTLDDSRDPYWLNNMSFRTYLVLKDGSDPTLLESKFPELVSKYIAPMLEGMTGQSFDHLTKTGMYFKYYLQPVTDIHLKSNLRQELEPNSDMKYVTVFSAVAFFILLLACINFINLSTARSVKRAKEVGLRKVVGSRRGQIISQFLLESILMGFLALLIALILMWLALPLFNQLSGKSLSNMYITTGWIPLIVIGIVLFVGFVSGSYPAFALSAYRPVKVLRQSSFNQSKKSGLRNVLVVLQFTISLALIIGTVIVFKQLGYIQNRHIGFDREQVLILHDTNILARRTQILKEKLLQNPEILNATVSGFLPVSSNRTLDVRHPEGTYREEGTGMQVWSVDFDYIETMGMEIIQGRNFSRQFTTDSSALIVNQTAATYFGWKEPVGKMIGDYSAPPNMSLVDLPVIGVVRDFHYESLRNQIEPLVLRVAWNPDMISLRLKTDNLSNTIQWIKENWNQFAHGHPLQFSFMDDRFDAMYRAERRIGGIITVFAVLGVFIGCLGLFGLAAFVAEQKTKEIGIRKVLGSSVSGVVYLLSKDFLKWVMIANLIAWPVSFYMMTKWLQEFAFRTSIGLFPFIIPSLLTLFIAFVTVSVQCIKAALKNPTDTLRYE
jgi:putative ABC transport system permease protein